MHFNEENNLSQETDVAGTIRIRHSDLVTSARTWFSSSSCIIFVTSWILNACFPNLQHELISAHISIHPNPMFLYTT